MQEAHEIAARGGMRLWLIEVWLEAGRLGLDPAGRAEALDTAARLMDETGLKRHAAALHLARAALALDNGEPDAARAALHAALPPIEEGRYGLIPELTRLVRSGGFSDFGEALTRLATAQAAYNTAADAQWEAHERYAAELRAKAGT